MSSITTITGMFTKKAVIAWALIAGLLLAVALLPKASATENSVVGLEASKSVVAIDPASESSFLGESDCRSDIFKRFSTGFFGKY